MRTYAPPTRLLSQLEIDAAKDWAGFAISNLGRLDIASLGGVPCVFPTSYEYQAAAEHNQGATTVNMPLYAGDVIRVGQRKTYSDVVLTKLTFALDKVGAPPGNYFYRIRRVSDDSLVLEKDMGLASALGAAAWVDYNIPFADRVLLDGEYRLCVEYSEGDAGDCIRVYHTTGETIVGEWMCRYIVAWADNPPDDMGYKTTHASLRGMLYHY